LVTHKGKIRDIEKEKSHTYFSGNF